MAAAALAVPMAVPPAVPPNPPSKAADAGLVKMLPPPAAGLLNGEPPPNGAKPETLGAELEVNTEPRPPAGLVCVAGDRNEDPCAAEAGVPKGRCGLTATAPPPNGEPKPPRVLAGPRGAAAKPPDTVGAEDCGAAYFCFVVCSSKRTAGMPPSASFLRTGSHRQSTQAKD